MYIPQHFAETDPTTLRDAVRQIRAGELITYGSDGLETSFLPLLISDDSTCVTGHLAKANGQWRRADLSIPALITWVGPNAYVSPSFYPSTAEDGRVVPTWNYTAIQAKGFLVLHEEEEWKRRHVESLTAFHEAGRPSSWSVEDAPTDYIKGMLKAIVGVEISSRPSWASGSSPRTDHRLTSPVSLPVSRSMAQGALRPRWLRRWRG